MPHNIDFWTNILRPAFIGANKMRPDVAGRLRAWTETWKNQHPGDIAKIKRGAAVLRAAKKAIDPDFDAISEPAAKLLIAELKVDLAYRRHTLPGGSFVDDQTAAKLRELIRDRRLDIDPALLRMDRWRERLAYWTRPKPKTPTLTTLAEFCATFGADTESTKWLVGANAVTSSNPVPPVISTTRPRIIDAASDIQTTIPPKPYSFFGGLI